MNFLNPLILIGLGAAFIPILIHFLAKRRKGVVRFPSIRLLERMRTESIRMLRIKQLIILLLRVLIIFLLVLAFARPALRSAFRGNAHTAAVIVIDSSASMAYVDNGERLFTRSIRRAEELLEMLGGDDMAAVIYAEKIPDLVDSGLTTDKRRLMKNLELRKHSLTSAQPGAALTTAMNLLSSSGVLNREIFYLTDGLVSAEPDMELLPDGLLRIYKIQLGPDSRNGAVIEDLRLVDKVLAPGREMTIEADILHGADRREVDVAIYLNSERKGKTTVIGEPGQRSTASFSLQTESPGWYSVSAEVDGGVFEPGESRYLAVHVPDPIRVLLVTGETDDGFYLQRALRPEIDNQYFILHMISAASIAPSDLANADVIVLAGVSSLKDVVYRSLISRVIEHGTGLMVFPSENAVDLPLYYDGIFRDILPARIERMVVSSENETIRLDRFNFQHQLMNGILSPGGDFYQPVINAYLRLSLTSDASVFAWFTDDSPAACSIECGRGRAVVMTVDPAGNSSELPLTGIFVPLMVNAVYYLSNQKLVGETHETGFESMILTDKIIQEHRLRVKPPDGQSKLVDTVTDFSGTRIEGISAEVPGIYSLASGENELARFAVNVNPDEVVMKRTNTPTPAQISPNVTWKKIRDTGNIRDVILKDRYGTELAGMFLFLGFFLLLLEMIIARRL